MCLDLYLGVGIWGWAFGVECLFLGFGFLGSRVSGLGSKVGVGCPKNGSTLGGWGLGVGGVLGLGLVLGPVLVPVHGTMAGPLLGFVLVLVLCPVLGHVLWGWGVGDWMLGSRSWVLGAVAGPWSCSWTCPQGLWVGGWVLGSRSLGLVWGVGCWVLWY